jgi:acyl-coenzyme A thioesterase PaaI-like protein
MKKIRNPFLKRSDYNCFGCSPHNKFGLQMTFFEDGEEIVSEWTPKPQFQGYHNVLHGGIQTTLMDELASWFVYVKLKTAGVTSKMEIKLKKTLFMNKGKITLRAKLKEMKKNIANISVKIFDSEGNLCTEGVFAYFTFPRKIAVKKFDYPVEDTAFYE